MTLLTLDRDALEQMLDELPQRHFDGSNTERVANQQRAKAAILAWIDAHAQPSPWRPIAEAPKDEDVFVFAEDQIGTARLHTYDYKDGGYWSWECEYEAREIHPTLWMEIPPLPVPSPSSPEKEQ